MAGNLEFIKSTSATDVSNLDITDCFSADYDVYYVTGNHTSDSNSTLLVRLIDSGGSGVASNMDFADYYLRSYTSFTDANRATNTSYMGTLGDVVAGQQVDMGFSLYVYNPFDSGSYTFVQSQSAGMVSSGLVGKKGIGVHKVAQSNTGLKLTRSAGTTLFIEANVYGVK